MELIGGFTALQIAVALGAALGASFVRGLTGFGMAILLVPILALALPPVEAVVLGNCLSVLIGAGPFIGLVATPLTFGFDSLVDENLGEERTLRKLARVLRVHFHRQREMAIGPDLSHRRTQVNSLLRAPSVAQAISDEALAKSVPQDKAYENARRYALEIAADYSYPIIRSLEVFLNWLWTRLYDGVDVQRLDEVAGHH